ncbi:protein Aster-B-like [Babylonia areolata]|uniref:protein Aster-B-like n=1 Tax=Babylonia areolata TaxID=304850 RepID=UPI003FD35232
MDGTGDPVELRHSSSALLDRSDVRHSASPEKSMHSAADRSSRTELSVSESSASAAVDCSPHSNSASYIPGLADKKSDSMSDSTSDKDRNRTLSTSRHSRERSFERSLDNILDKCSEKSLDLNLSVDSWNGTVSEGGSRSVEQTASSTSKNSKSDKKKKASWYSMLSPTYKSRSEDFRKTFKDIPKDERLIVEYSCALQKDILVQGRMYISQNWVCFYANIFRWETLLTIPCRDITAVTKEKTARVIPNAIQITTATEKYFFTSFGTRDKTYMMLFRIWQNVLMEQPMAPRELWQWIHYNYGEELGLTSSDDDYLPPPHLEDSQDKMKAEDEANQQKDLTDSSDHPPVNDSLAVPSNEDTDALVSDEVFNQSPSTLTTPALPSANGPPTDYGDTTEDSDSEVACSGHDHLEKLYLDEVFNLNVDKVFENIFTDSAFFRVFVGSRRTFDLNLPQWEEEPDEEGNRVRNISYTLTLNNSIGPRTSPSTEKQVCYKDSKPGKMYCVDCEICNGGIPYGDSFYNVLRYCLTRVSLTKCRLRVTSELKFRKSVMGMFKSMIEKSAVNGLTDYFRNLSAHLRREAERQENHLPSHQHQPQSKKKLRRRRKPHATTSETVVQARTLTDRQTSSTPPSPVRGVSLKEEGTIKLNADMLVRVIIIILIFLVLCNAVLFYKLWAIEASTTGLYSMYTDEEIDHLVQHPRSQEDWAHLLRQQRSLHHDEVTKWQEILHTSVQLLDQMKQSLRALQTSLQVRSESQQGTG